MTTQELVTLKDLKAEFAKIEKLSDAAKEIRNNRNESTLKAYSLIIAHLENIDAGTGKKDKKAQETFNELCKLEIAKGKARRFVEYSQAWRRHPETASSGNPEENLTEFQACEITNEASLKSWLFPKVTVWTDKPVAYLVKQYETVNLTKGQLEAEKHIKELLADLAVAYQKAHNDAMKKAGPATPPKDVTPKKLPASKTKPKSPPKPNPNQGKKADTQLPLA